MAVSQAVASAQAVAPATYARWRATTLGRITERLETEVVLDLAGPLAGKMVLDVGTGDGTYAIEAAIRGASTTGVDMQPGMLATATARASDRRVAIDFERDVQRHCRSATGSSTWCSR
jgi:2-polyprenyl-3-methyl-5-hydroxy-6-metoxy-1,4-benzoquinol methylase